MLLGLFLGYSVQTALRGRLLYLYGITGFAIKVKLNFIIIKWGDEAEEGKSGRDGHFGKLLVPHFFVFKAKQNFH